MNILLVSSTQLEIADILEQYGKNSFFLGQHRVSTLVTGMGMVNMAYRLGKHLTTNKYDIVISYGVGGSFDTKLELCDIVEVTEEIFADLGVLSEFGFEDMKAMGFINFYANGKAYYNTIKNPLESHATVPKVKGLTLNEVSGSQSAIHKLANRWKNRQIETMENAAFFQVCLEEDVPFYSFRSISNYVEPRNKQNWKLNEAIEKGEKFIIEFISAL